MTESKRVELASRPDRDAMYGPAFMGLPTDHGHLDLVPEVGDRFSSFGHPEMIAEIISITYRVDRNYCEITCKRSDGAEFAQPFGRLYKAIKDGQASVLAKEA